MYDNGPFRVEPAAPVEAMKTYRIKSPRDNLIKATCQQVRCEQWLHGWDTAIDESTPLGQFQASYIRESSGRTFRELRTADGLTVFRFEAFQRCFADHQTLPERFLVVGGDWRGNPRGERRAHQRAADWVEDFGLNQQAWKESKERG